MTRVCPGANDMHGREVRSHLVQKTWFSRGIRSQLPQSGVPLTSRYDPGGFDRVDRGEAAVAPRISIDRLLRADAVAPHSGSFLLDLLYMAI